MSLNSILLITGANTGLGFETVKALLSASNETYTILLGGRSLEKAEAAVSQLRESHPDAKGELSAIQIDIEDDSSIEQAAKHVTEKYGRLDVLINNAGAQFDQQVRDGKLSMREGWNRSWNTNVTGTHITTSAFAPLLIKSSSPRLLFIASGTSTLAEHDNLKIPVNRSPDAGWPKPAQSMGLPAYRSAKTGMNMMMREWCRVLKEDGVKVWCISPGMLATGLGGNQAANKAAGAIDPAIGANFIKDVVEGARDQDVGKVIRKDNVQPW